MLFNKQKSVILRSILIFVFLSGMLGIVDVSAKAQKAISSSGQNVGIDNAALTNYVVNGINNPRAMFGFSVNSAGDVNGDGFDDVIIGARDYWESETEEGAAFLYLGSSSGEFNMPAWSVQSNQSFAGMGQSVDTAGDVNGDGYDDILVGASQYNAGQTSEGAVFAYYGSPNGPSTTPNWIGQADQANAAYGWSVSNAGDVNKDGYDDVIIGSRYYSNGESHEGKAFLYLGSATGLASTPAWSKEINIQNAGFGYSVSNAGDMNGDGYSDVLVTSYNYIYGQLNGGKAYLFLGGPTGLGTNALWVGESSIPMDGYGQVGSDAGDVNGDGYSDILIGAPAGDNDAVNGKAYLYFGSANGPSQQPDWFAQGTKTGLFGMSLSSAGDYNHDGYDDILVGDETFYTYPSIGGAVFLYLGTSSVPSTSPYLSYTSGVNNSAFAASVGSAGRFNGDAYDDFLVGAPMWTSAPYGGGVTVLFFGHCASNSVTVTNTNDTGAGSLRQAIESACPGGTINFVPSLSGKTIALTSRLSIDKDLTIDGSSLSQNVKLDGSSGVDLLIGISPDTNPIVYFKNLDFVNAKYGVFQGSGILEVTNSSFTGNETGIQSGTQLKVINSRFSENATGIINLHVLRVENTIFTGNSRGIYNEKAYGLNLPGDATVINSTFTHNSHVSIQNENGTLTVEGSTFSDNTAEFGGGIENSGEAIVSHSQFMNNVATQKGGAIVNDTYMVISTSTFSGNQAGNNGGGIYSNGGLNLDSNTFINNTAGNFGGALFMWEGAQITNNTFSDNSALQGGGIYLDIVSSVTSTFTNNTVVHSSGGALYINNGNLELFNNILADSVSGADCYFISTATLTGNNNLIESNSNSPNACNVASVSTDPKLGPLQDNGGLTQTMALLSDSPAINAGDDANCPETDQRGVIRPQGSHCDIGAYEVKSATVDITIGNLPPKNYTIPAGQEITPTFPGIQAGPVKVHSDTPVFASERALFGPYSTFNEVMGVSNAQLTNHYWFTWYDNKDMSTWILVANPDSFNSASVTIKIAGQQVYSKTLGPNTIDTPTFGVTQGGPVEVISNKPIIVSERAVYGSTYSFNEVMGYPDNQLTNHYWFPWYDNKDMSTWVLLGNPDSVNSASVTIKIAGQEVYSKTLSPNGIDTPTFGTMQGGPVEVISDNPIFTSERSLFGPYGTFNEVMGIPDKQLSNHYWFTWYDNKDMSTWVLIGNPDSVNSTTVTIKVSGQQVYSKTLGPNEIDFPTFGKAQGGPVEVISTTPIFTSERAVYGYGPAYSFNEVMGFPNSQLTTDYWFTWYDNKDMSTWILVGKP